MLISESPYPPGPRVPQQTLCDPAWFAAVVQWGTAP